MKAELHPEIVLNTVSNFTSLANHDFYNGLTFHRVINGFMIQGGCPDGNGIGDPGCSTKGEFSQNGFANQLKYTEGVFSMARVMNPDSAGPQLFIVHKNSSHLDGAYAAFGKVIEGIDVMSKTTDARTDHNDRPMKEQKLKSVTVDTLGEIYPEPEEC